MQFGAWPLQGVCHLPQSHNSSNQDLEVSRTAGCRRQEFPTKHAHRQAYLTENCFFRCDDRVWFRFLSFWHRARRKQDRFRHERGQWRPLNRSPNLSYSSCSRPGYIYEIYMLIGAYNTSPGRVLGTVVQPHMYPWDWRNSVISALRCPVDWRDSVLSAPRYPMN